MPEIPSPAATCGEHLVRYLTNDDPDQAARARRLLAGEVVAVSLTVLLETEWVLRAVYGIAAADVIVALRRLAGLPNVALEDAARAAAALDWAERGLEFADALHLTKHLHGSREGSVRRR